MADNQIIRRLIDEYRSNDNQYLRKLFERLSFIFWSKIEDGEYSCSFCGEPATHYNPELMGFDHSILSPSKFSTQPLYMCKTCMHDLETGNVDIINPGDHQLNDGLHEIIRVWAKYNHYIMIPTCKYFEEHEITRNVCSLCSQNILNNPDDEIAISTCGTYIAHEQCAQKDGFNYDSAEISNIIEDLECPDIISSLHKFPEYTPPISSNDRDSLAQIIQDYLHTYDFSGLHAFASKFSVQHWTPLTPDIFGATRRCYFCPNTAVVHNEHVNAKSCETCYTFIQQTDIISYKFRFVRDRLQHKLNETFHIKTKASILYDNYHIQYRRCIICKKVVESNEDIAVTNLHFAHIGCLEHNVKDNRFCEHKRFHSKIPLNDIIGLPNFDVETVNRLIRQ